MLDWIIGGKADHPMADLKKARELIAGLPSDNSLRALEEITGWLDSLAEAQELRLGNRLDAVDLLDRAAKHHQFKLAPEYLEAPRLQKLYESRLWNTSFGFWKALGNSYLQCIAQYQENAPRTDTLGKDMPMVAGRALRALAIQLKWILLRYALIEDRIWRDMGRVYRFAESQGFAASRAQIYPGKHGESTVEEEFLKALMLVASSPDGLLPVKVHIAERVIAHFAYRFTLQHGAAPGCNFRFDLAMPRPPERTVKNSTASATVRFFGAGHGAQGLRDIAHSIHEKDGIPGDIHLGGDFRPKTVASVLRHLEQYWGENAPQRSAERRNFATRVTVVHGFAETVDWVKAVTDETSLEFTDPAHAESWVVFNASDGGYGTVIPRTHGDWLQVGCLVGLRAETSNLCRAGIVRRMTRDKYDQRRVGIQMLESTAVPVALSAGPPARAVENGHQGEIAMLLSSRPDDPNRELALLMRAGSFNATRQLQMVLPAGAYTLQPVALVEAGDDFDWARYRVVSQGLQG